MRTRAGAGRVTVARTCRGLGAWLSFLAVYVQIFLPLVFAVELRNAEAAGSGVAAFAKCHVGDASTADGGGIGGAPDSGGSHCLDCCPLCVALGAGAPFTAPAEPFIPVRLPGKGVTIAAAAAGLLGYETASVYEARAPPLDSRV